jgi:hypothetical protein
MAFDTALDMAVRAKVCRNATLHLCLVVQEAGVTRQMQKQVRAHDFTVNHHVPFGVTYDKIGTIQRRLAWPLHKDDTLVQSGSATADNIFGHFDRHPVGCIHLQITMLSAKP